LPQTVRGIQRIAAALIDVDMARFGAPERLASWGARSAGNNESEGKGESGRSSWRNHSRSVSAGQPILPAIDSIAAHCDGYWSSTSKTMRTVPSMTSGENFGDFLTLAPFSIEGAS
jgi:hypothetical protein